MAMRWVSFHPLEEVSLADISVDVWLYGGLAAYAKDKSQGSFANLEILLPAGSNMTDLLHLLEMPGEARGITFINGKLSAMVGLQPDLEVVLTDADRVAFFHLNSMWPFQYRHGVAMIAEFASALHESEKQGVQHSYTKAPDSR